MLHFPNGANFDQLWEKRESIAIEYETALFDLMRSLRYGLSSCRTCKDMEKLEIQFQIICWLEQTQEVVR
jgi:hypothetical protein